MVGGRSGPNARRAAPRGDSGAVEAGRRGRAAALAELAREIEACRRCPLGFSRQRVVVYRGSVRPQVVFVGEAPGAEEDRTGTPFVGRSGRILDEAIGRLGTSVGRFGVLNVVKCRPPSNKFDPAAEAACRPFLDRQLELLAPSRVVTLGAHALRALVPEAPPMLRASGQEVSAGRRPVFALLHPAASLRSRRRAARWAEDVTRLAAWLGAAPRETP